MLPRQNVTRQVVTRQNVTRQNVTRQIVTRQNAAEPFGRNQLATGKIKIKRCRLAQKFLPKICTYLEKVFSFHRY